MDVQQRLGLVKSVAEEIVTEDELKELLNNKKHPVAYDGFEPSGKMHIAQGLMRAITVNKLTKAGIKFKMLAADWHAWANNKLGGDLDKIHIVGDYMVEVWKACGMDLKNVEFVRSSEIVSKQEYWETVMKIARESSLKRVIRCSQIMGRSESENLSAAQIFYPCMQAADIFYLGVDIAQLGMDQRKVNMLAREVAPALGFSKPVIVSHHMLMGLSEPKSDLTGVERAIAMKMSKSNPDSAIFMTDTEEEVIRKIKKSYCPEGKTQDNPVLEYARYIIFERFDSIEIKRPEKFGGNISFGSYDELEKAFENRKVHPMDLKNATAEYINKLLEPVREHFRKNANAKKLLEKVNSY